MSRRCILVADDDPLIRQLVVTTLERVRGFELVQAADGRQALALARRHRPEIAFLDVDMPGPDGFEVCRRMRDMPETADTTIVVLSAARSTEAMARADEAGADRYITKPFSPLAVLRLVDRVGSVRRG